MFGAYFVGRKRELEHLGALHSKKSLGLVVVKGRRRIGKSRLVAEFAAHHSENKFWSFAGLAPRSRLDAQDQRDHFARQLAVLLKSPPFTVQDWSDAFEHLSKGLSPGDIILFDEISWMGFGDSSFIPKLKVWWDSLSVGVTLVLCGSVSTWIEDNILKSTAFFGRVHLTLSLRPLEIPESHNLLKQLGYQGSVYDTYKLLSIMGGVPWYLQQISKGKMADDIIRELAFERDGLLVLEFDRIFHDLFNGRGTTYKKILDALKNGAKTLVQVRKEIDFPHSGTLGKLVDNLVTAGFVEKTNLWSFKTAQPLKQSLHYICDPYMRFYLKLIEPNRNKIELGGFRPKGWDAHLGLQLEQLLLQNRALLLEAVGVRTEDVVADGPYRQTPTATRRGCQIDYLVQTTMGNLFIGEFKFVRRELGMEILGPMREKIQALKIPRGFSVVPVLFHIGGVAPSVLDDGYFYRIVDLADFLAA